jgi:exopolysaccharide biosynthesis polyprenyl glycosylphosphotransferase
VSRRSWIVLSLVADVLMVNVAMVASFWVRFSGELPDFNFVAYQALALPITALFLFWLWVYGLYEVERTQSAWEITWSVAKAATLGIAGTVVITFFVRIFSFPRTVFAISWLFGLAALAGWRVLGATVLPIKWPPQKVLIVGLGPQAREIADELARRSEWGYELVGFVAGEGERIQPPEGAGLLGEVEDVPRIVRDQTIDRVIVASPVRHREIIEGLALSDELDVTVEVIPELYEIFIGTVDTLVSDIPLMQLTRHAVPGWVVAAKRVFDLAAAVLLLTVASPVLLGAAIAVKLSSPGPVFYRQERVGMNERIFEAIKFRTMVLQAEADSGPVMAEADDPRITPAGRFLRRYRIDEFPQVLNILKGDMSFVGPRPERPFFVERFSRAVPGYRERFKVKPGVTGLAQVSGAYDTTPQNKLKFDLIYMYHQSLLMDLRILFETLRVVLTGRGAR